MAKKKILIVAHHLTVGGVQKSLISALRNIDYDSNDVTLYLRKNRLDLLPFVDSRVKVIVNEDKQQYYRKLSFHCPGSQLFSLYERKDWELKIV